MPVSGRSKPLRLRLALSTAIIVSVGGARAQVGDVQGVFQRGALAMREGRSMDAEKAFRDAVQQAPTMAEAHLDLGLVLAREGKLSEAIASVEQALGLNPTLESANMFLGIFYHQANRQAEARSALKREIEQTPGNAEALTWLGLVELAAGKPEDAVGPLDHAAELQPNDLDVLEYRGRAHNLVARDSYTKMARLAPDSWHVHRVRARLYADEGHHQEAIAEYAVATKLEVRNPELYEEMGDEYRKTSQMEAAQKAYAKELELSPNNAIAMYNLGSTAIERGDNVAGISLLREMLKTYESSAVAEYYLGRGLAAEGNSLEAVSWLEKSAKADPSGEVGKRSYYELARVYRKLQRLREAQAALVAYSRVRETEQTNSAKQIEDWRKLSTGVASDLSPK